MTELFEMETLKDLEERISHTFWDMVGALYEIEKRQLYAPAYALFSDYLLAKWKHVCASEVTWRQWRSSYVAYLDAYEIGAILHNEYAARKLKAVERSAWRLVATLARDYSADGVIRAADIGRAAEVVSSVLETAAVSGFVDPGDGDMVAIGAAVESELQERILRQRQHIADGVKDAGWSKPERFFWGGYDNCSLPDDWITIPIGAMLEIRWRVVEKETAK